MLGHWLDEFIWEIVVAFVVALVGLPLAVFLLKRRPPRRIIGYTILVIALLALAALAMTWPLSWALVRALVHRS